MENAKMEKSIAKLEKQFGKLAKTEFDIGDGEIAVNLRCTILGNVADVYNDGRIEMR